MFKREQTRKHLLKITCFLWRYIYSAWFLLQVVALIGVSYSFCCGERYISWHAWTSCGKIDSLCTLSHAPRVKGMEKSLHACVCCGRRFCLRLHAWKCFRGFCCLSMLGGFRDFFWPVKKCEFPTVMVGVLLLADITKVPRLPSCVSRITFPLLGVNQKLIIQSSSANFTLVYLC